MKRMTRFLIVLLSILFLCSCGKTGKLNEGDCKGIVAFTDQPKTFYKLDDALQNRVVIEVELQNLTTEKIYRMQLSKKNDYRQEISLHPGIYKVTKAYAENSQYTGLTVKATSETMEFTHEQEVRLDIIAEDPDAFTAHWMDTQPLPEIQLAEKYSGLIQINRKVISMKDILPELNLNAENPVEAYKKATLYDANKGISVTVQNTGNSPRNFTECEVISVTASKNTVVFPESVTVGSPISGVCHRKTGVYGEPTRFKGMPLLGWDLDKTYAVYQDSESGNRITIGMNGQGKYIQSITFDFQVFE
ncbi:MAG: hypothetical protein J6Z35_05050 [Lachnospiraceae bacterium]|nr:hypothetical protein [Lachnospiraceae bacterium]